MKLRNTKPRKTKTIIPFIIAGLVITILAYWAYLYFIEQSSYVTPQSEKDGNYAYQEEAKTGKLPSKDPSNSGEETESSNGSTQSNDLETPTISRANQSGDEIKVVATFKEYSDGNCKLAMTKENSPSVVKSAAITAGPSYYVCSVAVNKNELKSIGEWNLSIQHYKGNLFSKASKTIVEVM